MLLSMSPLHMRMTPPSVPPVIGASSSSLTSRMNVPETGEILLSSKLICREALVLFDAFWTGPALPPAESTAFLLRGWLDTFGDFSMDDESRFRSGGCWFTETMLEVAEERDNASF